MTSIVQFQNWREMCVPKSQITKCGDNLYLPKNSPESPGVQDFNKMWKVETAMNMIKRGTRFFCNKVMP